MSAELVQPVERFVANLADLEADHFVLDHFCQNTKLHVTPRARAHHSLLTDTVHESYVTPEVARVPKLKQTFVPATIHFDIATYLKAMPQGRHANFPMS